MDTGTMERCIDSKIAEARRELRRELHELELKTTRKTNELSERMTWMMFIWIILFEFFFFALLFFIPDLVQIVLHKK